MPKLTLTTVQKRIAALNKLAENLKKKDKGLAIKVIQTMMTKHDVSIDDLRGGKPSAGGKKARNTRRVTAKYRNPETGKTWSGRGRTPLWLSAAAGNSPQRDQFLIK